MRKKKNISITIFHLLIINLIAIGIFFVVKDTKASYGKVLSGNISVDGANIKEAEISIIDESGNIIQTVQTNDSGNYQIEANIDTTQEYEVKLKLNYDSKRYKIIGMEQQQTYEFGEKTKYSRIFNICSIIKDGTDVSEYQLMADKLNKIGDNVHVSFERDLNDGIQSIGESLTSRNVTNVIIYFGNMTDEEREDRELRDNMSGNPIKIIELGNERTADEALKKLAEQEYIEINTNSITITTEGDYAIGKDIIIGENAVLNCILEATENQQLPNLGSGDTTVTISGEIKNDSNLIENLDGKVELIVKNSNNTICAGPITISLNNSQYSVNVNLDIDTKYYIEFVFTEAAFNEGYSTQEYYIEKLGTDTNENNLETKVVNADDKYRRITIQQIYEEIDVDKEKELDTYGGNTKLIARTDEFTIDQWQNVDLSIGTTNNIQSSFCLEEREKIDITLEKEVSAVKIVLQDGTVFLDDPINNFVGSGSDAFKMIHMDDEIMHGATVYVEYTITAQYDNANIFESVTIRDLLDDADNNGGRERNIYYDPECSLITENGKANKDYLWEVIPNKGNKEVKCTLNANNNYTAKIVTSQIITPECEATYSNSVYIESYITNTGKRNGTWKDNMQNSYKRAGEMYKDQTIDESEEVKILPPFGK